MSNVANVTCVAAGLLKSIKSLLHGIQMLAMFWTKDRRYTYDKGNCSPCGPFCTSCNAAGPGKCDTCEGLSDESKHLHIIASYWFLQLLPFWIPLAYDRMKRSHQDFPKSCPRRRNIFCHEKFHVREMRRELPDMLLCHRRRVSWFQCVEREYFWVSQSVRSKRLQVSANAMWQCARMHVTCVYNHFVNCPVKVYLLHSWICVRREEQEGVSKGNRSDGSQWPGKKTSAGLWGVWLKWCWTLRCVEHVFCSHLLTMLQHVQN